MGTRRDLNLHRLIPRLTRFCRLGVENFTKVWGPVVKGRSRLVFFMEPLLVLAFIFFTGQVAWVFFGVQAQNRSEEKVFLSIPLGSSLTQVARLLEEEGLINNSRSFIWYVYLFGKENRIKAGHYLLEPRLSFAELLRELEKGRPIIHRVTIPEGLRADEITELLAKKGLIDPEVFTDLLEDEEFLASILPPELVTGSGEGFLFPDTYEFIEGMTEKEVLSTLLRRFRQVWSELTADGDGQSFKDGQGLSPYKSVILASIVEAEAKVESDRPIIAGVFINRIKKRYPLQSCATVQYALGERKPRLLYKDLEIDSPYNTYKNYGLPPGPICNPGRASLAAAIKPTETNYLYFVAKPDGSHIFSRSYREHLNAQRSLE
ncbi:MAG TPA: endolytic transglycosylase MltG [Firmicutes bacterium]|nr:endolytic transglycosylase MltG [Bacillota bacterium]